MVVWCSEPKGTQRGACSQHQKQDKNMNFTAGVCCTLCCSMQNRCHSCLPSVQDNVTLRTNCNCLTPDCNVITPECNEMASYIYIYTYIHTLRLPSLPSALSTMLRWVWSGGMGASNDYSVTERSNIVSCNVFSCI